MRDLCGLEGDGLAIYLPCATLKDEAIQVRQRLGEREASSMEGIVAGVHQGPPVVTLHEVHGDETQRKNGPAT